MRSTLLSIAVAAPVIASAAAKTDRPNILWLTSEDNNVGWVGCYGNPEAHTPNIDKLASEGFQYMNAFANAPVCAPSRSTWITGIYAISMGTHPMRSRHNIPHNKIKYYPDSLRAAGYYCSNVKKTDYNIGGRPDTQCWNKPTTDWNILKTKQPFFLVCNFNESHESRAQGNVEHTHHSPENVTLHKYHPDLPDIRKNYAKYYDAVEKMDRRIGQMVKSLEKSGLANNTIVIYCSDHGGVLPRSKRFLFDSGIHAPLVIRIPEKYRNLWPAKHPGTKIDRLVSFIDMPKTWLSIAGADIPDYMQGNIFLGPNAEAERRWHYAFRGRMDERYDNTRAIRDKRFLYIKSYMPYAPRGQHLLYLWKMKATQAWDNAWKNGQTDAITSRFFIPRPQYEELYDTKNDPDNIHNLISNPEYATQVNKMRVAMRKWQEQIYDTGLIPEGERLKRAKRNKTTIYEMVRNPKLYNLTAYLDAADIALKKNPDNLPKLIKFMQADDSGLRYWGISGCLMLGKQATDAADTAEKLLNDKCGEVSAMAAWFMMKTGRNDEALQTMRSLLKNTNSYTRLMVMNVIDWMGKDTTKTLLPEIKAVKDPLNYIERMKTILLQK